ncbi:unnamed protein product [Tilletia controversa]|nr:unnamed protein product [Tilletia controversa]
MDDYDVDSSPLGGVRERATRSKSRAPATHTEALDSSGPKKSRFQLAKEAERLKAEQISKSGHLPGEGQVERKDVPDPTELPSAQSGTAEVWLDADGVPLSAFKKAMLQRKGLGPPGRTTSRSQAESSTSSSSLPLDKAVASAAPPPPEPSAFDSDARNSELDTISKQNEAKIAAMSPEEVHQEVEELQDQIGNDLLDQFRQLAKLRAQGAQKQPAEREASGQGPDATNVATKKSVSFDVPVDDSTPPVGLSKDVDLAKTVRDAPSELHFHEHSDDANLESIKITHSGHLFSATPSSKPIGEEVYSMPMLLSLVQSSAPTQRSLGLTVLTRAISSSSPELETMLGAEKYIKSVLRVGALAARYTLSDRHRSVVSSARRCLLGVLSALTSGQHLDRRQAQKRRSGLKSTTGVVAPILDAGGHGFPEDLEQELTQALPSTSAAFLLVSDLLQSGLISGLRSDLASCDRVLSAKSNKPSSTSMNDVSAEFGDAIEGVTEAASVLQIIAQISDLHAESIAINEDESGHSSASDGDTVLQILVKQGIRARRWPTADDGEAQLDVIPEVLALVATICNSTPRAALKLSQQTNVANTLLRFVALPPWSLDEAEGEAQQISNGDEAARHMRNLRNWDLFSSTLLAYGGLSKHSLEGALLDAWSLWVDVSDWVQQGSFLTAPNSTSSAAAIRMVQLRCASRLLQLFGSWIARAVSSEGDFDDLTWTDVSPTKDVALAILGKLAGQLPGSTGSVNGCDDDRALRRRTEELHLLASAVTLLVTWLQAATESARNPARQLTMQLQADANLSLLFKATLAEAETMLGKDTKEDPAVRGGEVADEEGHKQRLAPCISALEAIEAIHELSRLLAMSSPAAAPASDGKQDLSALGSRHTWQALAKGTAKSMARFASKGIDVEERRLQ